MTPTFEPDRTLFPFESKWFQSSVGQLHYIDEGSGAPILFLHGNPTWSFLYRGIVIRLRKSFRCIAVDYPGFGLSPHPQGYGYRAEEHAEVVTEFVRGLALENLTIMGQDWGGPIGMRTALNQPDRIRALVMGNTWYWPATTLMMQGFSWVMSTNYVQGQIYKKNLFVERIMPWAVKYPLPEEVMAHYRGPLQTIDSRAGVAEFPREITRAGSWLRRIEADVPEILGDRPLLLTWGMHDPAFPASNMDRFRTDFTDVRVTRLDAKHYIQEDAPAEIAEAIESFLGS
jgi:haloalkane dehalogenase